MLENNLFSVYAAAAQGLLSENDESLEALTTLAANPDTNFASQDGELRNIFHLCVIEFADGRLEAIKKGVDILKARKLQNDSLKEALNARWGLRLETPLHLTISTSKSSFYRKATSSIGGGKTQLKIARFLVELGADLNIQNIQDKTPEETARNGSQRQIFLQQERIKLNPAFNSSIVPFFDSAARGYWESESSCKPRLELLRERVSNKEVDFRSPAEIKNVVSLEEQKIGNLFHCCVRDGAVNRLRYIKSGVDCWRTQPNHGNDSLDLTLNAQRFDGQTPLHRAATDNRYSDEVMHEIINILMHLGADPRMTNNNNCTPDEVAIHSVRQNLLLTAKTKLEGILCSLREWNLYSFNRLVKMEFDVNERDDENNTLFLIAMKSGREKRADEETILRVLKQLYKKIKDSPDKNAIVNHQNNRMQTLLSLAVQGGYSQIVNFLLFNVVVDTTLTTRVGNTIIHTAAMIKKTQEGIDIMSLLLDSTAAEQINTRNKAGKIPLHLVENPYVCAILCVASPESLYIKDNGDKDSSSADETQQTFSGNTPAFYAQTKDLYRDLKEVFDAFDSKNPKPIPPRISEIILKLLEHTSLMQEHASLMSKLYAKGAKIVLEDGLPWLKNIYDLYIENNEKKSASSSSSSDDSGKPKGNE